MLEMEALTSNNTETTNINNLTNIDEMLVTKLGPRQKEFISAILLTIVYSMIFITGMVGNICTCLVIVKNSSMQTTTNYYLFSLAMSDLLLIFFGLPTELYSIWEAYPWRLGDAFCYLRQSMMESTSYASVLTITAFTVERYLAICHPLLAHKISALSRAVKIIISIWIISLLVALPYAIHTRTYHAVIIPETNTPVPNSLICNIPVLNGFMNYMFQISSFLFFVGPVTIIVILYILIGIALHRSPLTRGSSDERSYASMISTSSASQQPRRVIIRMLVAVTAAFIVCWAPFHAQRLMILYVSNWTPNFWMYSHTYSISQESCISSVLPSTRSYITLSPRDIEQLSNSENKRDKERYNCCCTLCPCCDPRPHLGSTCTPRLSERIAKPQSLVVLRNGNDAVRVVFSQESSHQGLKDYETLPLNRSIRKPILDDDNTSELHKELDTFSSVNGSANLPTSPLTKKDSLGRNVTQNESSHVIKCPTQVPNDSGACVIENVAAGKDCIYLSQDKKTTAALRKAEKPRKAYAHKVNRSVSMTTASATCNYSKNSSPIIR